MIRYRPYCNTDSPQLAELWRNQPPQRSLAQPMSTAAFDLHVVSKPYFDRHGLVIAEQHGEVVGFAHAGFGPTPDGGGLSHDVGAVCIVLVDASRAARGMAEELLARSEDYLKSRGASQIYGGAVRPVAPFYQGLYGGSDLLGVPDSDRTAVALYAEHGYEAVERTVVLQRRLAGFRPLVDRRQMLLRRQVQVRAIVDPPAASWWDACSMSHFDRTRFELLAKSGGQPIASAILWCMDAFSTNWGLRSMGLVDLELSAGQRRQGMGTLLVGEALRQVHELGVALVEAQVREANTIARALFAKLGFEQVDAGTIYRKV